LGEPDAFPAGNLGLLPGMLLADGSEFAKRAETWRPWRAYAAMYLSQEPNELESEEYEDICETNLAQRA
jgi:3-methyladenine DNA glycosylase/8-oxoguanine DNA glycosylase